MSLSAFEAERLQLALDALYAASRREGALPETERRYYEEATEIIKQNRRPRPGEERRETSGEQHLWPPSDEEQTRAARRLGIYNY